MIWTQLARIFALLGIIVLGAAVITGHGLLLIVGCFLCVWIVLENIAFTWTLYALEHGGLSYQKRFPELGRDAVTWTQVPVRVDFQMRALSPLIACSVAVTELLPAGLAPESSEDDSSPAQSIAWSGLLWPGRSVDWSGTLRTQQAGLYQLSGLSLSVFSWTGFFHAQVFIEQPRKLNVYPNVFGLSVARPSRKLLNRLLQIGLHRFPFKGGSGELLEIRPYQPGDSMRQVAWKISARRDDLFVRELEREVPIRASLFLDGSPSARLGAHGERPLDTMIDIAGQVLRSTLESKDPVGLCLYTHERCQWQAPSSGRRHLFRCLRAMAEFSNRPPRFLYGQLTTLLEQVEAYLHKRHPRLMEPQYNPENSRMMPPLSRREGRKRRVERHMAAVVSLLLGRSGLDATVIVEDDQEFARLLSDFALSRGIHWEHDPLLSHKDIMRERDLRLKSLSKALNLSVTKAQDNELFVLFIDFIGGDQGPLIKVIRRARARHHRVLVALRRADQSFQQGSFEEVLKTIESAKKDSPSKLFEQLYGFELNRVQESFIQDLKALAVPVVSFDKRQTADLVARQVDYLKHGVRR